MKTKTGRVTGAKTQRGRAGPQVAPADNEELRERAKALGESCAQALNKVIGSFRAGEPIKEPESEEEAKAARRDFKLMILNAIVEKLNAAPLEVVAYLCAEIMKDEVMRAFRERNNKEDLIRDLAAVTKAIQAAHQSQGEPGNDGKP